MKAAVYKKYGAPDVVSIQDVPRPDPKSDEVLIKVHASTVSTGDWRARSLILPAGMGLLGRLIFGVFGPRKPILGTELSGVVSAVGDAVTKFVVGDQVVAYPGERFGAHAEFIALPADAAIVAKPENLSFEQAAAIPFGGDTALDFLCRKGNIKAGDKVLVNGASGTVGSAAVQLAQHFGATVTGVCSTAKVVLVRGLGAQHIVDYTREDFTKNGELYDIIIDTVATAPWARSKASLNKTGRLLVVSGGLGDMLRASFVSSKHGKKLIVGVAKGRPEDLRQLATLAESGAFNPVIDRCFPLSQIRKAHAHVDTGRKKGSVVINIDEA